MIEYEVVVHLVDGDAVTVTAAWQDDEEAVARASVMYNQDISHLVNEVEWMDGPEDA